MSSLNKKSIGFLAAVYIGMSGIASAESMYEGGYVEGSLGYVFGPSVDSERFSGTIDGITADRAGFSLDYDDDVSFGVEAGINLRGPWRIGLGITRFNYDLDKVKGRGTLTDGNDTLDLSTISASGSEVTDATGISFDGHATLYTFNAYYDFAETGRFQPFLGAGIGVTDIKNAKSNELTGSLYAGVKYAFDGGMYLGARVAYHSVDDTKDDLGIKYDSFGVTNMSILLGFDF